MASLLFLSFIFSLSSWRLQVQAKAKSSILVCERLSKEAARFLWDTLFMGLWFNFRLFWAQQFFCDRFSPSWLFLDSSPYAPEGYRLLLSKAGKEELPQQSVSVTKFNTESLRKSGASRSNAGCFFFFCLWLHWTSAWCTCAPLVHALVFLCECDSSDKDSVEFCLLSILEAWIFVTSRDLQKKLVLLSNRKNSASCPRLSSQH